jgi:hypothetical protein
MLVFSNDDATQLSFRVPMAIDEFLRAISVSPPPSDAPYQLQFEWTQSFDHKLQVGGGRQCVLRLHAAPYP